MAKPRRSRSASAAPRSPATEEKRANMSVFLPTAEKIFAFVYLVMSWVTVKVPNAPEPLACMRRSGITSRSKWASFSRNQTSWSSIGPRGPAVITFWLSGTGAPPAVVSFFLSAMTCSYCLLQCALVADAQDLDMRGDDTPEALHAGRHGKCVEGGAFEVPDQAAADADVVVVWREVGVEAHAVATRTQRADQPEVVEHPQRPVDGVERQCRQSRLNAVQQGLGIRMLEAGCEFAKNLEALVRQLDARLLRGALEPLKPELNLGVLDIAH